MVTPLMRLCPREYILAEMKSNALPIIVILVIGGFYLSTIREGHEWGDFSLYVHHAKNIAEGIPYNDTGYIYNPSFPYVGPRTYPPLFPLLLSPIYRWFGLNLQPMKVELTLFFIASLVIICLVFREDLANYHLAALVAVVGLNPFFWDFKDKVLSDIPFLFFTYLAIFLANRARQSKPSGRRHTRQAVLLGVSIYLCYATRTVGILLLPSLLAYDMIKTKRPSRLTLIAILSFLPFMIAQNLLIHGDYGYLDQLTTDPRIIYRNAIRYAGYLSEFWDNGYSAELRTALSVMLSGSAIVGYVGRIKKKLTILDIFPLFYVASIIVVARDQGARYLIPLVPSFVFYAFVGIMNINRLQRKGLEGLVCTALIGAILVSYSARYTKMDFGPIRTGMAKKETIDLFDYVKKATDERDIFIFRKPRELSLYTGRRASVFHRPRNPHDLWNYLHHINATYVVVGPEKQPPEKWSYLRLFVNFYRDNFQEVYFNTDFQIYRMIGISRPGGSEPIAQKAG